MSSNGVPASPTSLSITGNPAIDGLILKGLMAGAAAITGVILTWLNAHGFSDPNLNLMLSGAILSVLAMAATAVWGYINSRVAVAKGVQAGMNLVLAGQAIMAPTRGNLSMPVPVTTTTAQAIVKEFGDVKVAVPDEPALTAQLNQSQVTSTK